jgi:hypothetical protein
MTDEAKVVPLFGEGDRDAPITAKPRDPSRPRPRKCSCKRTEIDTDHRRLVCRDCGQLVDAFDFLVKLGREDNRWREARDAAKREARLAEQRRDDRLREETNARARVGRLKAQERELQKRVDRLDAELRAFTPEPKEA